MRHTVFASPLAILVIVATATLLLAACGGTAQANPTVAPVAELSRTPALTATASPATPLATTSRASPAATPGAIPRYQHIFLIVLENHSYQQIIGSPDAPRINQLAQQNGLATHYYAIAHPSEPNYVALLGGSTFGIRDDASYRSTANGVPHTIQAPSLADQLDAAGLSWRDYQQSIPSPDQPKSGSSHYVTKHNPFLNFAGTQTNPAALRRMVPDSQLLSDLRSGDIANFSFIVPDLCHDMHGASSCKDSAELIRQSDAYVGDLVAAIQSSAVWQRGTNAIVLTWDEGGSGAPGPTGCCGINPGGGHIATIVLTSQSSRRLTDDTPYNHYSLLRTIQEAFGLGCLQQSCDQANARPMTRLFGGTGSPG